MKNSSKAALIGFTAIAAILLVSCASAPPAPSDAELTQRAVAMMKQDFAKLGPQWVARLDQDDVQALCSANRDNVAPDAAAKIQAAQLASIKFPASGKFIGDWKNGEAIAQLGHGLQFSDSPAEANGGNCYACHQLSAKEISYGTIGPSLLHYGKLRGSSEEIQRYTYGKIYNADAYSACSNMPRFGHNKILTEQQITDVVALLLDPASPVNQ
jgi:L-cysteine S-thiosulfotransferase